MRNLLARIMRSVAEKDPKALPAAQAVDREVALIDCGNRHHASALAQVNERRVRIIARQIGVVSHDLADPLVISDRRDLQALCSPGALEPNERRSLMSDESVEKIDGL